MSYWLPKASIMSYTFAMVALWSTIARFCVYSSENSGVYVYALFVILSFYGLCVEKFLEYKYIRYSIMLFFVFSVTYAISYLINNAPVSNTEFLTLFFMMSFVATKDKIKADSFDIFVKLFGSLLALGLIEYFSFVLFQNFINLGIVDRDIYASQSFFHGAFCLFRIGPDVFRFQGIAEEPGLIGTLCGFLIYLTYDKRYKYINIVLWLSGVLSFSLAFYVLASIKLLQTAKNIKLFIGVIFFSFLLYSTFKESFDLLISERIEREDHGDNRSDVALDEAFERSFRNGTIWLGNGKDSHKSLNIISGVAGAKVWLYQYGILSFFIIFLTYNFCNLETAKKLRSHRRGILLFSFVFWISFYQRQYIEMPYNVIIFFTAPYMLCNYKFRREIDKVVS